MEVVHLPLSRIKPAPWNANVMDELMMAHLKESICRFGVVQNLVVRPVPGDLYELIGGNWRFRVLSEMGFQQVPCVIVHLDDAHARILAQALNRIEGEDDLGLKSQLIQDALQTLPRGDILSLLPETAESLNALSTFTPTDLAEHLQLWEKAQAVRLKHVRLEFTAEQLSVVEEALARVMPRVQDSVLDNPNMRGNAVYRLCQLYLEKGEPS